MEITKIKMSRKTDKYIAILTVISVLFAHSVAGFAEEIVQNVDGTTSEKTTEQLIFSNENVEKLETAVDKEIAEKSNVEKQDEFLKRIKQEFNLSKSGYQQLLNQINDLKGRLDKVSEDKITLKEQMNNIEAQIALTEGELLEVIRQVVETENAITTLSEEIEIRETALAYQKELLKDYVRVIYEEENSFLSYDENGDINAFKLLLADGTVGSNLQDIEYFNLLNEAGQQMVERLDELTDKIVEYQIVLGKKRERLIALEDDIAEDKLQLEYQKAAKENLLSLTLGQEQIYQQLVEQTRTEQEEMLADVQSLNEALVFIENKIAIEGDTFNPDDYADILDVRERALYEFSMNFTEFRDGLVWPVDPDRGISAYFHDPSYRAAFGVDHNAIDIPVYQGSPLRAASDAVVYAAKDNGYGYSYIILAHADGFTTTYGHVSSILVDEGQTVTQGSIIGLSGGMPGTKGAGYMTTGPHLHFEVKLNGQFVDPLQYLPLEKFTEAQIDNLPEKYKDDWEAAVYGGVLSRF